MKTKIILTYLLVVKCINVINLTLAAEFNPEDYDFSKISDIQQWIHPSLNTPETLQEMQTIIAGEMLQNIKGLNTANTVYSVQNNDNDQRFYGKTFPIIASVQFAFLKFIKNAEQEPIIVEIGAATGAFSYKIACALGNKGRLIVNDLSKYEIEKAAHLFEIRKNIIPLTNNNILFDAGDAKHFLERHHDLEGKVNLIYVQNVEHFMNPTEHQVFVETVLKMLAPNGRICSVAHTIPAGYGIKGNTFFDTYISLKKQNTLYPMFLKTNMINYQLMCYQNVQAFLSEQQMPAVNIPEANEVCFSTGFCEGIEEKLYNDSLEKCYKLNVQTLLNHFTPTIYEQAYKKATQNLNMQVSKEAGGFINVSGKFFPEFDNKKNLIFAVAIMKKIA